MKVALGGWALFECEKCGGEFAALVVPEAKVYCTNCGNLDTVPKDIELAPGIALNHDPHL